MARQFCSCGHTVDLHARPGVCSGQDRGHYSETKAEGHHGPCRCTVLEIIPLRDWKIARIDVAPSYMGRGFVFVGANLNRKPWMYGYRIEWYFTGPVAGRDHDRRYDCSEAVITPAAMALMCDVGLTTEMRRADERVPFEGWV